MRKVLYKAFIPAEYPEGTNSANQNTYGHYKTKGTGCYEEGFSLEGTFLGFGTEPHHDAETMIGVTSAIIETKDGTLIMMNLSNIKFAEPNPYSGYALSGGHFYSVTDEHGVRKTNLRPLTSEEIPVTNVLFNEHEQILFFEHPNDSFQVRDLIEIGDLRFDIWHKQNMGHYFLTQARPHQILKQGALPEKIDSVTLIRYPK